MIRQGHCASARIHEQQRGIPSIICLPLLHTCTNLRRDRIDERRSHMLGTSQSLQEAPGYTIRPLLDPTGASRNQTLTVICRTMFFWLFPATGMDICSSSARTVVGRAL